MPFTDPSATQNPTTGLLADDAWGDAVNLYQNDLRGAKAGCHVTTVTGTAITTNTIIPFETEVFDNQGCHSTVTNTSRITVPTGWGGLWYLGANMRCTSNLFNMWLVLNGDTTNGLLVGVSSGAWTAGDASKCSMSTIYVLAAGDYVEVAITGGANIYTGDASNFFGYFLHGPS